MNINELMPIGTVVTLKNDDLNREYMIISRFPLMNQQGKLGYCDYSAVMFPIGQFDQNNIFFNREQIETILYKGFENEKELTLRAELSKKEKEISFPKASFS